MRSNIRKSETEPEDDGSGEMTVWRIETGDKENELREIAREDYGEFYGGDCYIIKYYNHNARPKVKKYTCTEYYIPNVWPMSHRLCDIGYVTGYVIWDISHAISLIS